MKKINKLGKGKKNSKNKLFGGKKIKIFRKVSKIAIPRVKKGKSDDKINTRPVQADSDFLARSLAKLKLKKGVYNEALLKEHMPLIRAIAANVYSSGKLPPGMTYDDLVSYGIEGLTASQESFDAGRGVDFKVFSSYRIRGEMLDHIRKEWRYRSPGSYKTYQNSVQEKIAAVAKNSLDDAGKKLSDEQQAKRLMEMMANTAMAYLLSADEVQIPSTMQGSQDPSSEVIDNLEFDRERKVLWEEIGTLHEDERRLVNLFYVENKSQKEIAEILGYSKSKISRIHVDVLHKLRLRLNRKLN